jgi:hypothetical protein
MSDIAGAAIAGADDELPAVSNALIDAPILHTLLRLA